MIRSVTELIRFLVWPLPKTAMGLLCNCLVGALHLTYHTSYTHYAIRRGEGVLRLQQHLNRIIPGIIRISINRGHIELLALISLSERAGLVHPWPLRAPIIRNRLPSLLAGPFLRVFVFSISFGTLGPFFLFSSFVSCACVYSEYGTAGEPGAVAGVSGCWRVEGGLQGARSPLSYLGVACASRHEGCMNGLCLASICDFG